MRRIGKFDPVNVDPLDVAKALVEISPCRTAKRPGLAAGVCIASLLLVALVAAALVAVDWYVAAPADAEARYVGGAACIACHQQQGQEWRGSHHDLAMDLANPDTVLGDFSNQTLDHYGITSRMFRRGDRYFINTEGPDGAQRDFEIKYVFGVEPLQQYMVELEPPYPDDPQAVGRVQVLRVSWDTIDRKWFYLSPPDVHEKLAPDDPLHWTGAAQNWNHMCADCHSTNLQKNFDVAQRKYHTTFSEIDVSCEACHGPGSLHVDIVQSKWLFWDRHHGYGLTRLKEAEAVTEVQACAPCHSRRDNVAAGFTCGAQYYDYYSNALLRPLTYYPDGQIRDEVYVYGSFLQSKMFAKGIRCTDCHNPHSGTVKFTDNRLCTSCHQHHPAKYDTPAHHHHPTDSTGSKCIECHMPATPYMDIDLRRDHSFKVPRPDLSVELGTPNACTGCHLNREAISAAKRDQLTYYADWLQAARDGDEEVAQELRRLDLWSASHTSTWYQNPKPPGNVDFAQVLQRGWDDDRTVVPELSALAENRQIAAIVRASALDQLGQLPSPAGLAAARKGLRDKDPQVRAAAIGFFDALTPVQRVEDVAPLLEDPIRLVRIQAALSLCDAPRTTLSEAQLGAMKQSLNEYRQAQDRNGDLAGAHMAKAILAERLGDLRTAEDDYRRAIYVQPTVAGPRSNLAALLERTNRQAEADSLRHEELELMVRDSKLAPDDAGLQYRLGLAFYLNQRMDEAEAAMSRAVALAPQDNNYRLALALLYQKLENYQAAIGQIQQMLETEPNNATYLQLRSDLQRQLEQ